LGPRRGEDHGAGWGWGPTFGEEAGLGPRRGQDMTGGVWVASYVMLWVAVLVLGLAIVALLRQIGVLHARLRPLGVHFAGEGPPRHAPAPAADVLDYRRARLTVVAFTSPDCEICKRLLPGLHALARQYDDIAVEIVGHDAATAHFFAAFDVRSTPYLVAVDRDGIVQERGVANSLEQVEVMIEESLAARAG
jgi:thiol-disulfide isomerase/thioredoxin